MFFIKVIQIIKNVFVLLKKLYGKYRLRILVLLIIGFFSGFFEVFSVSILIPVFSLLTNAGNLGSDLVSQVIAKIFSFLGIHIGLAPLLALIIFLFILKSIAVVIFGFIQTKILADYEYDARVVLYEKALAASWPHLMKQKIGHLEHFLMTRVNASMSLLQKICTMILDFSSFLVYTVAAFNISAFTTISVLVLGAIILFFSRPVILKVKKYMIKMSSLAKDIANQINENVLGLKTIKSMAAEEQILQKGEAIFKEYRYSKIKHTIIKYLHSESLQPLSIILVCVVFALSYLRPGFNLAAFAVTVYLIQRIFNFIDKASKWLHGVNEAIPQVYELIAFQDNLSVNFEKDSGKEKFAFSDSLEFKNINFYYEGQKNLLKNLSFKIKMGEMVGIIGPSGVGKTTIVDLALRLFEPQSGEILLDGKPVKNISLKEWRRNISYVSQDIFLKNDTIEKNISFYDEKIKEANIIKAAKMANIYDFVKKLPSGFQTKVGERGARFSGGERQRIVLARALARNPKILILDEATSALDNESELLIKKSIEQLKGKMTIITIAHRLSTVKSVDKLFALEGGQITEEGPPDKLLKDKDSYFYKVHNLA